MIKPPYTKWINDIKTKLGFNRTMTASGEDVVDAVNKQAQQIEDLGPYNGLDSASTTMALAAAQGKALNNSITQLSNKLGFSLNYKGTNPSDWNALFSSNRNCIDIYIITGVLPKGAPTDAFSYGLLIVITPDPDSTWANTMIYIVDNVAVNGIYVKSKGKSNWLKISGSTVADKT